MGWRNALTLIAPYAMAAPVLILTIALTGQRRHSPKAGVAAADKTFVRFR